MTQDAEALEYRVNVKFPEIQQQLGDNGTISFPEVGIEFVTTDTTTIRQNVERLAVAMSRTSSDEGHETPATPASAAVKPARKPRSKGPDPSTASAPPPLAVPVPSALATPPDGSIPPFLKREAPVPPAPASASAAPPPPMPNAPPIAPVPPPAAPPPPPASDPALASRVVTAIKARGPDAATQAQMVAWLASLEAVVPAASFDEALECVPLLAVAKVQQIAGALGVS